VLRPGFFFCACPITRASPNAKNPGAAWAAAGVLLRAVGRGYGAVTDFTTGATMALVVYFAQKPNQREPPGGMARRALLALVVWTLPT